MANNQKNIDRFHTLTSEEKIEVVLERYPQLDPENVRTLLDTLNPDELTFDSLELAIKEIIATGGLGGSLVNLTRENSDLRERIRTERSLNLTLIIAIIVASVVIVIMLFLFAAYPKYKFFQTVDNSVICEISPQNNPALTDAAIQDFARISVLSAYTFDYLNYRDQLDNATTRYFTSEGRAAFNQALRNSGSLNHIIANNLSMKTVVTSAAQIEDKGVDNNGQAYWVVRMPVTTEFYTGGTKPADVQKFVAMVRIVSTKRDALNTKGIGVMNLTLRPPKSE